MSATLRRLEKAEAAIEEAAQEAAAKATTVPTWLTEDELANAYERWHAEGGAAGETDFPRAIAFLRESLAAARLSVDPPFDPPPTWRRYGGPVLAARDWRACRFPAIREAVEWLEEMEYRSAKGVPPVSEQEFLELAAWLERNRERLYAIERAGGSAFLELGGGERAQVWDGTYGIRNGPRAEGAGKTAEVIRKMKAAFPEVQHG